MLAFDLRVSNVYLSYLSNAYVGRQEYPCTSLRFVGLIGLSASFGGPHILILKTASMISQIIGALLLYRLTRCLLDLDPLHKTNERRVCGDRNNHMQKNSACGACQT